MASPDPRFTYCPLCASPLRYEVPEGDERVRDVCPTCKAVHYHNPKVVAGSIPEWEDRILLCRRAIEPRHGFWTLPAGFMENGETSIDAAARETREEAAADVEIQSLYVLFNLPHINQVYLMYRGRMRTPEFGPGRESLEVALFREHEIPWQSLAFPVIAETLRLYYDDLRQGTNGPHVGDLVRHGTAFEARYLS